MENKEYYTPDRTDFFIGYEYEYESNNTYGGDKWIKAKFSLREVGEFDEGFMLDFLLEKEMIRVPYLSKGDIVELGWKLTDKTDPFIGKGFIFEKGGNTEFFGEYRKYTLTFYGKTRLKIHLNYESSYQREDDYIYQGECKSKNELKKLMKDYLNIPI